MAKYLQNPQDLNDDDDDDGDLWKFLPSDILPVEHQMISSSSSNFNDPNHSSYNNYNNNYTINHPQQQLSSCMGLEHRLSPRFSALSFSEYTPPPHSFVIPPPYLGLFRPAVQCICGSGSLPIYSHHFMNPNPNPVLAQAERFIEERVEAVLDRQRRTPANRIVDGPVYPFSGNGVGYARDYGGTGVFLPRVVPSAANNISSASSADHIDHRPRRRRQGSRSRHDEEAHQYLPTRNAFMNMVPMKKPEDYCIQVSSEMGLPEDWTY
ncbi:hypothetical protein ACH5RR_004497 [Cinchona calisaya]|uniref:Uncharacterized protein n=1 Tax=Cinchona calisaya TaxID=153742 RepID=A0ABD3AXW4_9GENT